MAMDVAHVDCDAFYASIEKRDDPSLKDKPVIVGGRGGRGVATTACYIARQYGARSAMPMFQCLKLCPDAVVIPPNIAKYKKVAASLRALFLQLTDRIEPVSLDEAYLDLSPEHGPGEHQAEQALKDLQQRVVRELGITVSFGLSANKFLAKIASDMNKPNGFTVLPGDRAAEILAPMPVKRIHGVGPATERRLTALGIHTIADLQARPEAEMIAVFGRMGRALHRHAWGQGSRKVSTDREAKSISSETTFRVDLHRFGELAAALDPLCDRVAESLQRKSLGGTTVVLKLKTGDFQTRSRQLRLPDPTNRTEVIRAAARSLLERECTGQRYRLIGVGVSDFCPAAQADPPTLFSQF